MNDFRSTSDLSPFPSSLKTIAAFLTIFITLLLCSCSDIGNASSIRSDIESTGEYARIEDVHMNERRIDVSSNEIKVSPKTVTMIGRNHIDMETLSYSFTNSASGISFCFSGSSLDVELASTTYSENTYSYISVYIDESGPQVLCIDRPGWQTVTQDLDPGVIHTAKILKRSEANFGSVIIPAFRISEEGLLYRTKEPKTVRRIQVLGDSIACGYGNMWDGSISEEITFYEDGTNTYATMIAESLESELDMVCISGIGAGNDRNSPYPILPHYMNQDNYVSIEFDFCSFVPSVIIIGLGTNDVGQNSEHQEFIDNAVTLVRFIRSKYPEAEIIWTYGAMGSQGYITTIQSAIDLLVAEGDNKLHFLVTDPPTAEEGFGLHGHPTVKAHERLAAELTTLIRKLTGW